MESICGLNCEPPSLMSVKAYFIFIFIYIYREREKERERERERESWIQVIPDVILSNITPLNNQL